MIAFKLSFGYEIIMAMYFMSVSKMFSCSGEPRGISPGEQTGINSNFSVVLQYYILCLCLGCLIHLGSGILDMDHEGIRRSQSSVQLAGLSELGPSLSIKMYGRKMILLKGVISTTSSTCSTPP